MTEPSLALQTAIRDRLVSTPAVIELVPARNVIDGPTRPEQFPAVIIGAGQVELRGHYSSYRNVAVYLDLHLWTREGGLADVKRMGGAVWNALGQSLAVPGFDLAGGITVERAIYMRDPDRDHGHAVLSVTANMGFHL